AVDARRDRKAAHGSPRFSHRAQRKNLRHPSARQEARHGAHAARSTRAAGAARARNISAARRLQQERLDGNLSAEGEARAGARLDRAVVSPRRALSMQLGWYPATLVAEAPDVPRC